MAGRSDGEVLRQVRRLVERGSVGGLSEWQLVDRYASRGDESAFEALVAWHGPMVLGVCRRVLNDPHAVEDAFQATFLVLVRKAGTLGERDAIGHWLYGVARRVALHARSDAARRRSREVPADRAEEAEAAGDGGPSVDELAPILDEELGRLPTKYRAPVVLCYLEGLTHEEAARQLRWPIGSVKGRLSRAKDLLRGRLARRGVVPSAALVAASLGRDARAAVPEALRSAAVRAAVGVATGGALAGFVSLSVVRLMEGVLSAMLMTKLKVATTLLVACGGLALGAWSLAQSPSGKKDGAADAPIASKAREDVPPTPAGPLDPAAVRDKLAKPVPLKLNQASLQDVLKAIRKETSAADGRGVPIYVDPAGLQEAGATIDSPVTFAGMDLNAVPIGEALDRALRPLKLGVTTRDGLLVVTSRQEATLIEVRALNEQLRGAAGPPEDAKKSPRAQIQPRGAAAMNDDDVDPEDEAASRAILDALNRRIPMSFPEETPLEEVLAYIRKQTQGKELPQGIPIYLDPRRLGNHGGVTLDLENARLKTSLRLMLNQVGLAYVVKDGLLIIANPQMSAEFGASMGGMGGGFGGGMR